MALVRRHDRLLLRLAAAVMLVVWALCRRHARAQSPAPAPAKFAPLPAATLPPPAPHERVLDIRIVGNHAITREKVLANMGTKIDQPYDQSTFDRDVRKLAGKNWFVNVEPTRDHVPGGVVITLRVVERPTLQSVQYLGNKKIKKRTLDKQANLKAGDSLDPFAVQEAARKIETYYQTKGFNDVKVEVLEGDKPTDRRAVFIIHEGQIQKILEGPLRRQPDRQRRAFENSNPVEAARAVGLQGICRPKEDGRRPRAADRLLPRARLLQGRRGPRLRVE